MNLKKILCKIGIHRYRPTDKKDLKKCSRCPRELLTIHAIYQGDLVKMVENNKIPAKGALKAIKRGHLIKSDFEEDDSTLLDDLP